LRQIFIEKLPLLLLSAASCAATVIAQSGPVGSLQPLPFSWRIGNAIVTPLIYLKQIVWPVGLAPFYPYPSGTLGSAQVVAAALALLLITAGAVRLRNQQPWLLVGWLWFLIMLLPVIGVVQVGMQARADRYTYLPQIGVYIAMTWSVVSATHRRFHRLILPATAAVALAATSYVTWLQTSHWRDSRALWTHTAAVTRDNEVAENNLGILLEHDGRLDDAISHYQRAVAIQNQRGQERYDLTLSLAENNLANAFVRKGDAAAAVAHYRRATELRPDYADAFYNLGTLLFQNRDVDEAITSFEKTIALRPDDAAAHGRLGDALRQKGADARALVEYEKAAQLEPHALWAQHSLAWLLATSLSESVRNGARAVQIARDALHLPNGENGATIRALAAGYAAAGQFPEAIAAAQAGLRIAAAQDDSASVQSLQSDLDLYRMNIPVREIAPSQ
jgi:tetratricopeptide (TPR) repeat protein